MGMRALDPSLWHELSGYLDHAFGLEPQEREHWLQKLTTSHPAIAGTLRELLAEREALNANHFLETSPLGADALAALTQPSMAGKQIGAYTIERLLGRGGMGEVWLASRSDGRYEGQCAIKFLDSIVTQPRLIERFREEGRLLARLGHPNIARLLDAGSTDDGKQFLVLEYVDGDRIDRYCDSHNLDVDARIRLFIDAVLAVAHAHSNLIVHRDLKPSNVLVAGNGVVKLLDFGIAKLMLPEQIPDRAARTRVEEIALTPEYAAPEQLLGELPSTATDVYQLGMLLYELLIGRHPLPAHGTRAERIKAALDGRVPRASELAKGALRKKLRGDLDAILAKALHTDPTQRYATAAALHDELVRYLNREPVGARRGASLYQARRFVARHRVTVAASAAALVSLFATLVFALTQADAAATERDRALALATRNLAVTEFLGVLITEAAEADKPVTVSDMLARSEKLALADTGGDPQSRAAVLRMIGLHYLSLGDRGKSAKLLERALTLLGTAPAHGLRSELICNHGLVISAMGRAEEAIHAIDAQLAELARLPAMQVTFAECLGSRGTVARYSEDAEGALRYTTAALAQLRASGQASNEREADALGNLANSYQMNGRNREASQYYEEALRKFSDIGRESSPNAIVTRNNLGLVSEAAGVPRRALQVYDDILRILRERDPRAEPPVYMAANRARALETIGRFDEAEAAWRLALQISIASKHTIGQVVSLTGLASAELRANDLRAAKRYLDRATQTMGSPAAAENNPRLALLRGRIALASGSFDEAERQFARAAANKGSKATAIDGELGQAEALLRAGDALAAKQTAQRALDTSVAVQIDFPYSQRAGRAWLLLGRASQELGDPVQAQKAFVAAVDNLSHTVDENHPALLQARSQLIVGSKAAEALATRPAKGVAFAEQAPGVAETVR
jgi:eukaryotic-like serine/threonine-protein kinase